MGLMFGFSYRPEHAYKEFQDWLKVHGDRLVITKQYSKINFQLSYLPSEFFICQNIVFKESITKKEIKELYEINDNKVVFKLSLESKDNENILMKYSLDKEEYMQKQYYFMEGVSHDVYMISGNDTLFPVKVDYENNYNLLPNVNLTVEFEKIKNRKNDLLVFEDRFFENNKIEFEISELESLKIPKIK